MLAMGSHKPSPSGEGGPLAVDEGWGLPETSGIHAALSVSLKAYFFGGTLRFTAISTYFEPLLPSKRKPRLLSVWHECRENRAELL